MRKAVLLYNPLSGRRQARRLVDVEAAAAILRQAGVEATTEPTRGQADAGGQARKAIARGCDVIFACGGDGTIHSIAQALATTQVHLAVLPMGTAGAALQ